VIAKAGKPIARIVSVNSGRPERVLGIDAGRVVIDDDFDTPLPDGMLPGFDSCRPGVST
jgi:antitoxin (DNA-binding transcriptional repressor) of toxin-antitoxin stability system